MPNVKKLHGWPGNTGDLSRGREKKPGEIHANEWMHCREAFHQSHVFNLILLSHERDKTEGVEGFIHAFEKKLGIEKSEIGPTSQPNVTWIKPAAFWRQTHLRRSLFTILLRVSLNYLPQKDFSETLYSHPYTMYTRAAVELFLDGYTLNAKRTSGGWRDVFYHRNRGQVMGMMKKED